MNIVAKHIILWLAFILACFLPAFALNDYWTFGGMINQGTPNMFPADDSVNNLSFANISFAPNNDFHGGSATGSAGVNVSPIVLPEVVVTGYSGTGGNESGGGGWLATTATITNVLSLVPGPIGTIAGVINAGAEAAQGHYAAAAIGLGGAVLATVGLGVVAKLGKEALIATEATQVVKATVQLNRASGLAAKEGIYEFTAASGKTYVGQSGNIAERLAQHLAKGKLPPGTAVQTTEVLGGKTAREIAEQLRINELGGVKNLENINNPIGPARQHLLPKQ